MIAHTRQSANFRIEQPCLLLVEGNDDVQFFRRIVERRRNRDIQIIGFGGKDKLGEFLTNVLVPRVRSINTVRVIGVVRDADDFCDRAFQSVCSSLQRASLPIPNAPAALVNGALEGDKVSVAAYIMPDNAAGGDLETLILRAIEGNPALGCVENYLQCLNEQGLTIQHERKAKLHAFLASNTGDPTLQPGQAIDTGVIPWDSPAFEAVHRFLDMLDAA